MVLGEKITAMQCIIYDFAKTRINQWGVDEAMAEVLMGNVYRKFQEDAYHASLRAQLSSDAPESVDGSADNKTDMVREDTEK